MILPDITTREEFRQWLTEYHATETECFVYIRRGRPMDDGQLWYLDAVEEALCFGWIDSSSKLVNGVQMQRFSPRRKRSPWTELNKERVRRLERLGLMTDAGRAALPPMGPHSFRIDPDIEHAMKEARCWTKFKQFPALYQRIRAYNAAFYKKRKGYEETYEKALKHLIAETKKGRMFGEWNDYGRLIDSSDNKIMSQ